MWGWMALAVAVSLPVLCLLYFPTVLLRPLPDSQSKDGRYIHIPSRIPNFQGRVCLCSVFALRSGSLSDIELIAFV
jgi:hypothetical protein